MTIQELDEQLRKQNAEMEKSNQKIVAYARGLVSVLEDAQRPAAARELKELLFILDAQLEDSSKFLRENMDGFLELLKKGGPGA